MVRGGVIIACTAMLIMVAACTGTPAAGSDHSPSPGNATASSSAVAYAACMRSHHVPNYPDPDSQGNLPKGGASQFGVSSSVFAAAQAACQQLLPATGGSFADRERQCYQGGVCPADVVNQMMTVGQKFARCMRSHSVPNWPDPSLDPQGKPFFDLSGHGWTRDQWHAPAMTAKAMQCARIAGGSLATG